MDTETTNQGTEYKKTNIRKGYVLTFPSRDLVAKSVMYFFSLQMFLEQCEVETRSKSELLNY